MLGDTVAELLIEPIIAWRTWSAKSVDGQPLLTSPLRSSEWHEGQLIWDGTCGCERSRKGARNTLLSRQRALKRLQTEGISEHEHKVEAMLHALRSRGSGEDQPAPEPDTVQERIAKIKQGIKMLGNPDECHCGINAFATAQQMLGSTHMMHTSNHVLGQVELSGTVRKYEAGWRAERGRVVRIWSGTHSDVNEYLVRAAAQVASVEYMGSIDMFDRGAAMDALEGATHAR